MKTAKFISKLIQKVRYPIDKIKTFSEKLKQTPVEGGSPHRMFLVWLLEIIEYGILLTVAYAVFIGFNGIGSALIAIPAFGIARYLVLDFAGDLSIKLRKKH